ncbi:hypothetical protein M404DRAFT_365741 [Pisolithus tinctorius Marx 270]|uniref:Uncharacterized protein n=1 Tax=Pisolithus tinctorius Marx 270 TaxID=870435 RepID=A0A0C3P5T6_PISTI|nr:hypothetical protein M404DRAFT_365741 [Pisolithus tinctorius Marx 270]
MPSRGPNQPGVEHGYFQTRSCLQGIQNQNLRNSLQFTMESNDKLVLNKWHSRYKVLIDSSSKQERQDRNKGRSGVKKQRHATTRSRSQHVDYQIPVPDMFLHLRLHRAPRDLGSRLCGKPWRRCFQRRRTAQASLFQSVDWRDEAALVLR